MEKIAVIMTCHNRRDTTVTCLQALYQQTQPFDVYLTDDGSSDGTADAIATSYPQVRVLQGNGNLFWVGGMRLAFAIAMQHGYDYYLWLNDDTILETDTLQRFLAIHRDLSAQNYPDSIIVGSTQDPQTGKPTYGGAVRTHRWYSNKYEFLAPSAQLQQCDTMYGNCVLIPDTVAKKVGNIDAAFIHSLGDLDYGLRAKKQGCSIWVAPGYVGICTKNSIRNSWADTNLPLLKRLQKIIQVKGFPLKPWTVFCSRHSGPFWFFYWVLPYLRAVIGYQNLNESPTFSE